MNASDFSCFFWGRAPIIKRTKADRRQVVLIQQGARRNYVYARQLEQAGLLRALITDAAWLPSQRGPLTRVAIRVLPKQHGPIKRRTVNGIASSRLYATILPNLASSMLTFLHPERRFAAVDEVLSWRIVLWGIDHAKIIVNYSGNGGSFLERAKAQGSKIITDFVITPKYLEIEEEERRYWVGWETESSPRWILDAYRRRMAKLVRISDIYLCPSETVARDLSDLPGFDAARVRLMPYGVSDVLLREPRPIVGRVLFAGTAGLRKGLPYLAEAARLLKASGPEIEIVVAGHVTDLVRNRSETRDLIFLGALDRESMADEFAKADIFCLPSLAEGSASSVFEAMANGLPTVTTKSSGTAITDGVDGIIMPERNGVAIADAIRRIVGDRGARSKMSSAARTAAVVYSTEACGRRFIGLITSIVGNREVDA